MPITSLRPAQSFATAVAVAALITTGAACSSSSPAASKATTSNPRASSPSADHSTRTTQPAEVAKTTDATPNPCTIVTAAEVQAITGTAATPAGPTNAYLDDFGTTRVGVGFLRGDSAVFIDGLQITSSDAVVAAARDAASKV